MDGPDRNFVPFLRVTLIDVTQTALVQNKNTPLGYKQYLCELITSNAPP